MNYTMKALLLTLSVFLAFASSAWADIIKQGSTYNRDIVVTSSSGGNVNSLSSASFTVQQSQAGAAFVTVTPTITFKANGHYTLAYTTAMTSTLGSSALVVTATGALQQDINDQIFLDVPGGSVVASNFVAAPTLSQIQGGVPTLAQITALFPAEYLTSAEQAYLATLLARIPGTIQPQTGDSYAAIAALPTSASIVTAIKADSLFSILLNRQKQRFAYVPSTHSYQPLLDDGTTAFGSPLILTVDANGNITNR
jgi:hypothetical protein